MLKQYYKVDENGFLIEVSVGESCPNGFIEEQPPNGLYKPKWTGTEWVNGTTKEEYEAELNIDNEPSELDLLKEQVALLNEKLKAYEIITGNGGE